MIAPPTADVCSFFKHPLATELDSAVINDSKTRVTFEFGFRLRYSSLLGGASEEAKSIFRE